MKEDFTGLSLKELIKDGGFDCPYCGGHHDTTLKIVECGSGALTKIPATMQSMGVKRPYIICDIHTWEAAGKRVVEILEGAGVEYAMYRFEEEELDPDEHALGCISMHFDARCDVIMAIGSGVLNDLSKVLGNIANLQTIVVGTAPSMDGYASNSSSMLVGGVKTTLYNKCPTAIIADTDVMRMAPMRMLKSGLGDVLAKYVSICEWRISNLLTGEAYCEGIASLVRRSLKKLVAAADRLTQRDPETVESIVEGLILTGIAMSFAKSSRPASGLEHYFSHIWDMMCLERGQSPDLHGIQVGVGTVLTIRLYQWIRELTPDKDAALASVAAFDRAKWEKDVARIFGKITPSILVIEDKVRKNDPEKHAKRLSIICEKWDTILSIINEELPEIHWFEGVMRSAEMPMLPRDLSFPVSPIDVQDALRGSREIRDKYLGCSMLWDMGLLDEACERVLDAAEMR